MPPPDDDWKPRAACRGADPHLFHPDYASAAAERDAQSAPALAICARCPVRQECLDDALDVEDKDLGFGGPWGIRGGLTEFDRLRILRARRAQRFTTRA